MTTAKLSPKEKRKVERLIRNVGNLHDKWSRLSEEGRFIYRQQLRVLLIRLGADRKDISPYLHKDAVDIIIDWKPFKIYRLRKLINNGRRRQ
jgi:hypothetical protein